MDNINVIRVGFFAPEIKIAATDGGIDDPIDRTGSFYTCLVFVNPDDDCADLINKLESGLPRTASGTEIKLSVVVPLKLKIGKAFKERSGFQTRLFCDSDLRAGSAFSVVDSSKAKPSYHPVIFIVGDEGSVRYRETYDGNKFDFESFRQSLSRLI